MLLSALENSYLYGRLSGHWLFVLQFKAQAFGRGSGVEGEGYLDESVVRADMPSDRLR